MTLKSGELRVRQQFIAQIGLKWNHMHMDIFKIKCSTRGVSLGGLDSSRPPSFRAARPSAPPLAIVVAGRPSLAGAAATATAVAAGRGRTLAHVDTCPCERRARRPCRRPRYERASDRPTDRTNAGRSAFFGLEFLKTTLAIRIASKCVSVVHPILVSFVKPLLELRLQQDNSVCGAGGRGRPHASCRPRSPLTPLAHKAAERDSI